MTTVTKRHIELTEQIEHLLALPLPVPAEKHLLREQLVELEYQRLGEQADYTNEDRMQLARAFALRMVPQRLDSYPMHLREKIMAVQPGYLKEYASRPTAPPMSLEDRQKQHEAMLRRWGPSPDTKQMAQDENTKPGIKAGTKQHDKQ